MTLNYQLLTKSLPAYVLSLTLSLCTNGFDAGKHYSLRKHARVLSAAVYGSPSNAPLWDGSSQDPVDLYMPTEESRGVNGTFPDLTPLKSIPSEEKPDPL